MGACPNVLAVLPGIVPSTTLCVVKPLIFLQSAGKIRARVVLESLASLRDLEWADLVVFSRNCEPLFDGYRQFVAELGIPYIYDIDDNLFALPESSRLGQDLRWSGALQCLERYLRGAALVRVYSRPMLQQTDSLGAKAQLVVPPVDWSAVSPVRESRKTGKVKIVYATSRMEDELAGIFVPALADLLQKYGDRLDISFLGFKPFFPAGRNVHFFPFTPNYDHFMGRFSRSGYDIGLAPLLDDLFHRSKTNNKFREYCACRIAGIYSDVDVYSECVKDGETGLLVPNEQAAWYSAMKRLIEDEDLRNRIKNQGYESAKARYLYEQFLDVWLGQIQGVMERAGIRTGTRALCPERNGRHKPRPSFLRSRFKWFYTGFRKALRYAISGNWGMMKTGLRWIWITLWMHYFTAKLRFVGWRSTRRRP